MQPSFVTILKSLIYLILISLPVLSHAQKPALNEGLIAHFPFESGPDDISLRHKGVIHGASLKESRCGEMSYYFDGKTSYIEYGNDPDLNGKFSGLSFGAWIKPEAYFTMELSTILAKWAFDPKNDHFGLWINKNLKVIAAVSSDREMENGIFSQKNLISDTWHHVFVTWHSNGQIAIYIDGVLDKTGKQTGRGINAHSEAPLRIGRQVFNRNRPFKGNISDVRIYNRHLSHEEVHALFTQGNEICERAIIQGIVLNKTNQEPIHAEVVVEDLESGIEITRVKTHQDDPGSFQIKLPVGKKYSIYAEAENYMAETELLDLSQTSPFVHIYKRIFMLPFEAGMALRLNNIFFDFAKATLRRESNAELNRILPYFQRYPNLKVELSGHTDAIGSEAANQILSENRAVSVRNYLINLGIPQQKIMAIGYGESLPVDSNETEDGRQQNRRVEFKILEK
ncbi:MAG: OmpA family protein [Cyclobacteriaceae bacterium]|nr:OmpA family protein [Cyclobacteriaceae bacterium]